MDIEVFTGVAGNEFKPLAVVSFHCPCCGRQVRMPAEMLIRDIADRVEEYYRGQYKHMAAQIRRLEEVIEHGNMINVIRETVNKIPTQ